VRAGARVLEAVQDVDELLVRLERAEDADAALREGEVRRVRWVNDGVVVLGRDSVRPEQHEQALGARALLRGGAPAELERERQREADAHGLQEHAALDAAPCVGEKSVFFHSAGSSRSMRGFGEPRHRDRSAARIGQPPRLSNYAPTNRLQGLVKARTNSRTKGHLCQIAAASSQFQ
jgi:hypothetical protein